MFSKEQSVKLCAVYNGAHAIIDQALNHFKVVRKADTFFETCVCLFAVSAIAFPERAEDIAGVLGGELLLYADGDGEKGIRRRLKLYEAASSLAVLPCGFWATSGINRLYKSPVMRAIALFGDFLVYPESANDYENAEWPILDHEDTQIFSQILLARIAPEIVRYLVTVAEIITEIDEEE